MLNHYKSIDLVLLGYYSYSRSRVGLGGGRNGFPFEIKRVNAHLYEVLTEHKILDKLEKLHEHAAQCMYKNAAEVSRDMRTKYGL